MIRVSNILPQISRFFSAKKVQVKLYSATTVAVCFSVLGLFAMNATQSNQKDIAKESLLIFHSPMSVFAHYALASKFKSLNDEEKQAYEIQLIQDLLGKKPSSNVLGESIEITKKMKSWNEEPKELEKKLIFWKKIISNHPDYRDAYLQAAYLSKLLHHESESVEFTELAKKLDPSL